MKKAIVEVRVYPDGIVVGMGVAQIALTEKQTAAILAERSSLAGDGDAIARWCAAQIETDTELLKEG